VDRHRADDLADAAAARLAHAEQPDDVGAIGVKAQRPARPRLVARRHRLAGLLLDAGLVHLAIGAQLVAHVSDQLAVGVLEAGGAEVRADAPVHLAQLVFRVALDRKPAQQHHAAAVLELVADRDEIPAEPGQREILAADVAPGEPASLDGAEGPVDLVDRGRGDRADPVGRLGQVASVPGFGARARARGDGAHEAWL
jgi:hypothetical protein